MLRRHWLTALVLLVLVGIWQLHQELLASYELYEAGDYERAIVLLGGVVQRRPDDPMVLYNLACFESLAGRREAAVAHVRRTLELDPSMRTMVDADSDFDPIRDDLAT